MAQNDEYFHESRQATIRNWILWQMLRGAGAAALVLLAVLAVVLALVVLSWALPEEARASLDGVPALLAPAAQAG